ncbi:hypothetical protein Tco_0483541 [Tanacetum coccineum]
MRARSVLEAIVEFASCDPCVGLPEETFSTTRSLVVEGEHAVATASAQNDNGSLEAESIEYEPPYTRFCLPQRILFMEFEEWKFDVLP